MINRPGTAWVRVPVDVAYLASFGWYGFAVLDKAIRSKWGPYRSVEARHIDPDAVTFQVEI